MANNDWLDFPDFDVAAWRAQTASLTNKETATWKKPLWEGSPQAVQLPAKAIDAPTAGNPWAIAQSPAAAGEVVPMLMGGVQGIRFNAVQADASWLTGVHLDMVDVYIDADTVSLEGFDLQEMAQSGWTGHCTRRIAPLDLDAIQLHQQAVDSIGVRRWMVETGEERDLVLALANGLMQLELFNQKTNELDPAVEGCWDSVVWKCWVGANVLEGVAYLRAMRLVWDMWLKSHGLSSVSLWIDAVASNGQGEHTHRTDRLIPMTASTYAAVIGGADSIETMPHDAELGVASTEGQRWARNIQHLMREESGLHRVFDPMGGSGVVESWTASLVEMAWAAFEQTKMGTS